MHPGWRRCSSLKYSRYSRSSRLASRGLAVLGATMELHHRLLAEADLKRSALLGPTRVRFVLNASEYQSFGRRGGSGPRPIARGQHLVHPLDRTATAADFNQRTDDDPDHVAQKSIPSDLVNDQSALSGSLAGTRLVGAGAFLRREAGPERYADARRKDQALGREPFTSRCLKRREIVGSLEHSGGRDHRLNRKRA